MNWPYYTLRADGALISDDGSDDFPAQRFASAIEAEAWLVTEDIRGTVR